MVKSQPTDLNLGFKSGQRSQVLLNAFTSNVNTKWGNKDRTSTYKGKGVEKLVVYSRTHNKTPRTHANSPRAETTATATSPLKKMDRKAWERSRVEKGLATNKKTTKNYLLVCYLCGGTGHFSFQCPMKTQDMKDLERIKAKRQHGLKQKNKTNLLKFSPRYEKVEQHTEKVYCEEDEFYGRHETYNKKTGKKMIWREASSEPIKSEIIDIDAGFNVYGDESGEESTIDTLTCQDDWFGTPENRTGDPDKDSKIIEHDPADVLPVGHTWAWMDDEDLATWSCVMTKMDSSALSKPKIDKRPDQFRGADLVHTEPTYSLIRYTRTPTLIGMPVWYSKTIDLIVSEEVATQIVTASNVNYTLKPDAIFNRITQAAKTVSKVNEDRYSVLHGYFPRNDTIVFANNIAKCYFWQRRQLKSGVDFTRCQDTMKPKQ